MIESLLDPSFTEDAGAAVPAFGPIPQLLDGHSLYRRVTLTPAMCGHNSLFLAQVADWTWSTVSRTCGTEMYREKNESGSPTYLSFYYLRIHGGPAMQMHQLTFGDVVDVVTTAYNFGSESILTLHRVARAAPDGAPPRPVTPLEFYEQREDGCLYVEALNRWITRSRPGNEALVKSSPAGIATAHLPLLPDGYSPRLVYDAARRAETFHDVASADYEPVVEEYTVDYTIDAARDLNGVGLVFFASFASIVDSSLLKLWKHLGRDVHSFTGRVVRDRQLCYTANVEVDSAVRLTLRSWRRRDDPGEEVFNVVIRDARNRLVLVATLHIHSEHTSHASV
jgi:probable biosynthetic protein (TIGR04098 family)